MPRRDVVLTGLIAFGAGVAVGANWGKLRKKIGPVVEKLGLRMADLGDFLSADGMEEFFAESMNTEKKASRPRVRKTKAKTAKNRPVEFPNIRPVPKRKTSRRKPVIVMGDSPWP